MTPPFVPASWAKSIVRLNGFHVEPSMLLNPVRPFMPTGVRSVMR